MQLKTAEVIPVLNGGDHEKPNNYHPILLLQAYRSKLSHALSGGEWPTLCPSNW